MNQPTYNRIPRKAAHPLVKYTKQLIKINISVVVYSSTIMIALYTILKPNSLHDLINRFCLPSSLFNPLGLTKLYGEVRDPLLQFMRRTMRTRTGV
jgi:hypothetical protein